MLRDAYRTTQGVTDDLLTRDRMCRWTRDRKGDLLCTQLTCYLFNEFIKLWHFHVYCCLITHLKEKHGGQITSKTQFQQNNCFFRFIIVLAYHLGTSNNRLRPGEVFKNWSYRDSVHYFYWSYCSPCDSSKLTWTPYDLLSAVQENWNWNPRYR